MTNSTSIQLSHEVLALKKQVESSIRVAPNLWDSVTSALNATDASLLTSLRFNDPTNTIITSGTETIESCLLEERY